MSLILGGNALNTNESVTKEEEKDGRGGWPPSPPCSSSVRPCDPPPHTASVVLSVKPSVNTRLSPPNRLACIPRSTGRPGSPLRPNSAHHSPPFPETRGPVPASSRPLIWAVSQPGMSSPPSQARTAEKLSGISPSLLCALTKRVHSPRVKISCTLAACWALGGERHLVLGIKVDFICRRSLPLTRAGLWGGWSTPLPHPMPTCPGARFQVGRTSAQHSSAGRRGPWQERPGGTAWRGQWPGGQ